MALETSTPLTLHWSRGEWQAAAPVFGYAGSKRPSGKIRIPGPASSGGVANR